MWIPQELEMQEMSLERMGIEKTHKYLEEAHLVLFVLDASCDVSTEDMEIYERIKHKEHIVILNKSDLKTTRGKKTILATFPAIIDAASVSAYKKEGIEHLEKLLTAWVRDHEQGVDDNAVVASMRSESLLKEALDAIDKGISSVRNLEPSEFSALLFREALNSLAKITGEVTTEDVLNRIFDNFCIGK